jgi:DNA-binding NtrC family response regulator
MHRPRRALIVTDVHLLGWALSSAFGHSGFAALAAQTAEAAVDTLRTVAGIDLVVISLSIGPAQVAEVVHTLAREAPGTPAILLAAEPYTPISERHEGTRLLELPFSVDDIVAAAEELVPAEPADMAADADGDAPQAEVSRT